MANRPSQAHYLQQPATEPAHALKVPATTELWLRSLATDGRRNDFIGGAEFAPLSLWVDHQKKTISAHPPSSSGLPGHKAEANVEHDSVLKYWSFVESHPSHTNLSKECYTEATEALTWAYTGK